MLKKRWVRIALVLGGIVVVAVLVANFPSPSEPGSTVGPINTALFDQGIYQFPHETWILAEDVQSLGWDEEQLKSAEEYFRSIDSAAMFVVHNGALVADWGDTSEKYLTQSIRKSLLSSLLGIAIDDGHFGLATTLEELEIDDSSPSLTPLHKQATIEHLLHSSSGINHSALYEPRHWKGVKENLGEIQPGTEWIYNNWDFNALGTIFEQATGSSIGEEFLSKISGPLMMEDFKVDDVVYVDQDALAERISGNSSDHQAFGFRMSTRDLARFGLLYLGKGNWDGQQVVPEEWVEQSTSNVVDIDIQGYGLYGFNWWVDQGDNRSFPNAELEVDAYYADGSRGHFLIIIPDLDLVIAHQVPTKGGLDSTSQIVRSIFDSPSVTFKEFGELVKRIVAAHPSNN